MVCKMCQDGQYEMCKNLHRTIDMNQCDCQHRENITSADMTDGART